MICYAIIIEKAEDRGYGAYMPDLLSCIGMGANKQEVMDDMAAAIKLPIQGMQAEGLPITPHVTEVENLYLLIE